jgi:hypothetical protein
LLIAAGFGFTPALFLCIALYTLILLAVSSLQPVAVRVEVLILWRDLEAEIPAKDQVAVITKLTDTL